MSSFLINIIRKGAGLPQEALPRPSLGGDASLPLDHTGEEEASALLKSDRDAPLEEETDARAQAGLRTRRRDSNTDDSARESHSPRESKTAPTARRKIGVGERNETKREEREAAGKSTHARASARTQLDESDASDVSVRRASNVSPRFARESARDEQAADFSVQSTYTNQSATPEADARDAAMILERTHAPTSDQRMPLPRREAMFGDEENTNAPESQSEHDATRIVPRTQEPVSAIITPSIFAEETASHVSQPEPPRVHVRIGTVEVRMNNPPPQTRPAETRASRGLESYTAARRYLDRKWY